MAGNIRQNTREWSRYLWDRVKALFSGLDTRVTALEQGGGGGGGAVSGVKGDAESTYRTGNVNLTPANLGAKAVQSAVSDPTASGTGLTFIDSISQDAQGVITPTKKTVAGATQSADGLMSSTDKAKLDGIASGAQVNSITGVKGNAESSYRTGNVNLTPANIGAVAKSGDAMTGGIALDTGDDYTTAPSSNDFNAMHTARDSGGVYRGGLYSTRYTNGKYGTILFTRRDSNTFVEFGPLLDQSGNPSYVVGAPTALLDALGVKWKKVTGTTSQYGGIGLSLDASQYMVIGAYAATASGTNYIVNTFVSGGGTAWTAKVEDYNHTAVASTSVTLYVAYIDFGAGNIS